MLGRPRGFQVGADGARVAFLRSAAGDDPVNRLWVLEVATGAERLVADPADLLAGGAADLPPRSGPGGSGPGSVPAASSPSPPIST
jgi:dipeptidyl-peptidase-4